MKNEKSIDKLLYDIKNMQPIPSDKFHIIESAPKDMLIEIIKVFNILLEMFQEFLK